MTLAEMTCRACGAELHPAYASSFRCEDCQALGWWRLFGPTSRPTLDESKLPLIDLFELEAHELEAHDEPTSDG